MKSSSCEFVFLSGHLPVRSSSVRSSSISNQCYDGLVHIFCLNFKFQYFPGGWGRGWGGGQVKSKLKLNSAQQSWS